ncbi:peptidase S41 [Pseudoalteromonas sp. CO348]|uniref:S41 family peptidase n=1 Tax=Pseudoalteromonas sp. CO348 TaxID=1777271 RepID=UPI00102337BA|nr:peptidase S41 [Pseudoalteromonas sp. CO348]RZF99347.1 peptidase S41 [Pseudoalteromonas sp. CO348]
MIKQLTSIILCFVLTACGSDTNDTTPTDITSNKPPTNTPLPSSPKPLPDMSFDQSFIDDVSEFVKLAHAVQYFYPSAEVRESDWSLFIAESIVELNQTPSKERREKGIELIRQIAPYLVTKQNHIPKLLPDTQTYTWIQNAPANVSAYTSLLTAGTFNELQEREFAPNELFVTLNFYQSSLYLPLYLPVKTELTGGTYTELGRWQVEPNFAHIETCMATVSGMWANIQHFWPYFEQIDVDWPASLNPLLAACLIEEPNKRLQLINTEFTKLNDNHIIIKTTNMLTNNNTYYGTFYYEIVEGKAIVTSAQQDDPNGVEVGDELLTVNGEDIIEYLSRKALYSLKSELQRLSHTARQQFFFTEKIPLSFTLKKSTGTTYQATITPIEPSEIKPLVSSPYVPHSPSNIEYLGDNIYKLNIYNVTPDDLNAIKETLKNAQAVVIDFRHYPQSWDGWRSVLSWFIKQDAINDTLSVLWQGAPNQADKKAQSFQQIIHRDANPLSIPAIVLSSRRSQSQGEHALIFARSGGLPILGEHTSGINGTVFGIPFFGGVGEGNLGVELYYTNTLSSRYNGDPLINAGIAPDYLVPRTRESIINGTDNQVERAIDILKSEL